MKQSSRISWEDDFPKSRAFFLPDLPGAFLIRAQGPPVSDLGLAEVIILLDDLKGGGGRGLAERLENERYQDGRRGKQDWPGGVPVSYTHLTLPTNREV